MWKLFGIYALKKIPLFKGGVIAWSCEEPWKKGRWPLFGYSVCKDARFCGPFDSFTPNPSRLAATRLLWLPQYTCKLKSSLWLFRTTSGEHFLYIWPLSPNLRDKTSPLNFCITLVASRSVEDPKCWLTNTWMLQRWIHLACAGLLLPSLLKVTGKHLLSCWVLP